MRRFGNTFKLSIISSFIIAAFLTATLFLLLQFSIFMGEAEPNPHFQTFNDWFKVHLFFQVLLTLGFMTTRGTWVEVTSSELKIYRRSCLTKTILITEIDKISEHWFQPNYRIQLKDKTYTEIPNMLPIAICFLKSHLLRKHGIFWRKLRWRK